MKILHISDTHVGSKKHFNEGSLLKAIEEANTGDYDLLIHTGDVTQEGKQKYYQRAEVFLENIEIPKIIIPGNHDKRSGGISLFEDYIGCSNGVKVLDDTLVIYVDSSVSDTDVGRVGMVEFNMIKEALKKNQDKDVKIVATHHHVLPTPRSGRERNVLSNAGDLLELFIRSDVDLVLSGHRHYPNVHQVENTAIVNAGTVSGKKTRHGDVNSFNIIEIGEDEITVNTRRIDGSISSKTMSRSQKRIFSDFGERIFRLVHMSNTFMSNSPQFQSTHFSNAVGAINGLDADLVVHCGGIVEEGIPRNYRLAKKNMQRIDPPIIYTPAGRDINYLGYKLFQEFFGDLDQSFSGEDVYLQGVSSSQYDSSVGIVGATERKRLFDKLSDRDESFTGLFLHHNIVPIPHAREKGLLEDGGDLLREIVDQEIDLAMTGTSSHPFAGKVGNTLVVNANSISSVYQRSRYGNSFNVVDVYENVIVVSEINSLWGKRRILGVWSRNGSSKEAND